MMRSNGRNVIRFRFRSILVLGSGKLDTDTCNCTIRYFSIALTRRVKCIAIFIYTKPGIHRHYCEGNEVRNPSSLSSPNGLATQRTNSLNPHLVLQQEPNSPLTLWCSPTTSSPHLLTNETIRWSSPIFQNIVPTPMLRFIPLSTE